MTTATFARASDEKVSWVSSTPYILIHVFAVAGLFWFPPTWELVALAIAGYYVRMFGITAGYHRYFSHRGYKTNRVFQFLLALLGSMSAQKGVLWWAGHHRHHHKVSDLEGDIHSPKRGFWWSHHLWILCEKYNDTPHENIKDFAKYPELRFLQNTWMIWPWVYGLGLYFAFGPAAGFWGGAVSTVLLWHGTFTINSLAHVFGSRRYETTDTSRNNLWLALLTLGEGWHNNHHFYQSTARNGFYWWEIDVSYYVLKVLSWLGIVWDLREPPAWVLEVKANKSAAPGSARPGAAFAFPVALLDTMQDLAQLRAEPSDAATRLGELAAEAAQKASEVAHGAAQAAHDARAAAAELKTRLAEAAADAAERAAALAREAAEAATDAARAQRTRATEAWADTARRAAEAAHDAAERARAIHLELQPA